MEAKRLASVAIEIRRSGKFPGGDGIVLVAAFMGGIDNVGISRKSGFGDAIDALKPLLLWFQKNETEPIHVP